MSFEIIKIQIFLSQIMNRVFLAQNYLKNIKKFLEWKQSCVEMSEINRPTSLKKTKLLIFLLLDTKYEQKK